MDLGNDGPGVLLDGGAQLNRIEGGNIISGNVGNGITVSGLSGSVNTVKSAGYLIISFAGVGQPWTDMVSFDTSSLSRNAGVEVSGFIGFPTLRQLKVQLDYRDNLMQVVYDPNHGYH